MTHVAHPTRITARTILEADGKQLSTWLRDTQPLADAERQVGVGPEPWARTLARVGEAATGFLDIDIVRVLVVGWCKYAEVLDAARASRNTTEKTPVDLAGRTVSLRQHPRVDVKWGEWTVASVPFDVVVDIQVQAVTGYVRGGSLVEISTGRCDVDISVESKGQKLVTRPYQFDPELVVDLGDGIRLVDWERG